MSLTAEAILVVALIYSSNFRHLPASNCLRPSGIRFGGLCTGAGLGAGSVLLVSCGPLNGRWPAPKASFRGAQTPHCVLPMALAGSFEEPAPLLMRICSILKWSRMRARLCGKKKKKVPGPAAMRFPAREGVTGRKSVTEAQGWTSPFPSTPPVFLLNHSFPPLWRSRVPWGVGDKQSGPGCSASPPPRLLAQIPHCELSHY